MDLLIPNNKSISVLFLCSGLCENEMKIIHSINDTKYSIHKIGFMDMIYENNTITKTLVKKVKKINSRIDCIFMTKFSELMSEKYDIIISINFQIMLFIDDISKMNNHYDKKWDIYCIMQQLYGMYADTSWIYYNSPVFDISNFKKYNGSFFNKIAHEIIKNIPQKFIEDKLNYIVD